MEEAKKEVKQIKKAKAKPKTEIIEDSDETNESEYESDSDDKPKLIKMDNKKVIVKTVRRKAKKLEEFEVEKVQPAKPIKIKPTSQKLKEQEETEDETEDETEPQPKKEVKKQIKKQYDEPPQAKAKPKPQIIFF